MDAVEKVRQLLDVMAEHELAELEVEEPDLRIRIRKNVPPQYLPPGVGLPTFAAMPLQPGAAAAQLPAQAGPGGPTKDENLVEITSPMVGTFYRSPRPGADPYVSVDTEVDAETVICIIEAMKVMNEIKAEVTGRIVEILVQDAEPVEFGQVLFLVEPVEE